MQAFIFNILLLLLLLLLCTYSSIRGPDSSVGIATMGLTVRGSNPGGASFSARPDRPWDPPSLLYNGYQVFPGGKVRQGRAAEHSPPSGAVIIDE